MSDLIKTGVLCTRVITVFDIDGITPKIGLNNASFTTKNMTKDGAVDATVVTVTEIDPTNRPGRYKVTWTPAGTGDYEMRVAVPTYADCGYIFEFFVTTDGVFTAALVLAAITAMDIDGKTLQQAIRLIAATTAGKSSGDPGSPVFKGLDQATTRVSATVDSDGNRTSVTYS